MYMKMKKRLIAYLITLGSRKILLCETRKNLPVSREYLKIVIILKSEIFKHLLNCKNSNYFLWISLFASGEFLAHFYRCIHNAFTNLDQISANDDRMIMRLKSRFLKQFLLFTEIKRYVINICQWTSL